jgi:hypothetical protein
MKMRLWIQRGTKYKSYSVEEYSSIEKQEETEPNIDNMKEIL